MTSTATFATPPAYRRLIGGATMRKKRALTTLSRVDRERLAGQALVGLDVLRSRLLDHVGRKRRRRRVRVPVPARLVQQPVADVLLVERRLRLPGNPAV